MDTVEITELVKIDADRVDGVASPASGIPILLMKSLAPEVAKGARDCPKCDKSYDADHKGSTCENCGADLPDAPAGKSAGFDREAAKAAVKAIVGRKVDESPDIAGGTAVLAQIADLIIAEAQELKSGQAGEIADIQQLACAAEMIWCWRTGEEAVGSGSVMPATALMQSAAFVEKIAKGEITLHVKGWEAAKVAEWTAMLEEVVKAKHSAADRRALAEQGNALSDGSYPIADEEDLKSAAILAQSGHGDVEGAKRLISRRAKELGVKNPLDHDDDDASKAVIAQEGTDVDTVVKESDDLAKVVADAVTKATAPLEERITALSGELAKVKAAPVPGGPVQSAPPRKQGDDEMAIAAKAVQYDAWAESISDPVAADAYRKLAARERAKLTTS